MPFPTGAIITTDLDSDADSPLNARGDIKQTADYVNDIIGSRGAPNGIAPTGVDNIVPAIHLPANLAKTDAAQSWSLAQAFQAITITGAGATNSSPVVAAQFSPVAAVPGRFFIPIVGSNQRVMVQWMTVTYNITAGQSQTFNWASSYTTPYVVIITVNGASLVKASATIQSTTFIITCDVSPISFYVVGIGLN